MPTDKQLDAYTATDPCVKFNVTEVPWDQFAQKIAVSAMSSNAPDIMGSNAPDTQSWASKGMLLPIDKYLPQGFTDDAIPATLKELSYGGKIYSPGLLQTALVMFYNKSLTDAAGITPPRNLADGWTWTEAVDAMKKCQETAGGKVDGLAVPSFNNGAPGEVYTALLFLRSAGDPNAPQDSSAYKTYYSVSPDGKTVDGWLNTPEAVDAATFYASMYDGPNRVTSKSGVPTQFQDGKACFAIVTGIEGAAMAASGLSFELGGTPMPYFKTPIIHTGSLTLTIPAKSKHPDIAAKVVLAMSSDPLATDFAKSSRAVTGLKSVNKALGNANSAYPFNLIIEELTEWGQPRPLTPHFTEFDSYVSTALRDIALGANPAKALNDAVNRLTPIMSQ